MRLSKAVDCAASITLTLYILAQPVTSQATTSLSIPPAVTSTGHQNDKLVTAGYLDAVAIYDADPSGSSDSTAAIQRAMDDGINYSMAVYLPTGTYLVSNTLKGVQDCNDTNNYKFGSIAKYGMHKAPSLVGPARGMRPTIVLKDKIFTNSARPQPLIYFVNTTANAVAHSSCMNQWQNDVVGAWDILFDAVIRDVNFKLGNNPGAVGIQYYSAQYSYMQNVAVDATGGYVGIAGAPATEVWTNIEVNGGQYGVVINQSACGNSAVAGLKLENQTVAGLGNFGFPAGAKSSCGAITITGFNFQESGVPAISLVNPGIHISTLDLIDGSMTISGGGKPAIDNPAGMAVYMNNVYIKAPGDVKLISNNTTVAPAPGATVISPAASGGWDYFQEYAHNDSNTYNTSWGGGGPVNGYTVINDVKTKNDFNSSSFKTNGGGPPSDLVTRNVPGQMPWVLDSNVTWVTDYGADPTGESDSTTAIRKAIAASLGKGDKVFLPRGNYSITGTLTLNPNTQFFGVPGQYSGLGGSSWVTNSVFQPFIQSANSKSGKALISDIGISLPSDDASVEAYCKTLKNCTLFPPDFTYNPMDNTYLSALNWQVGRNSVLNQLAVNIQWDVTTGLPSAARKLIQVSGGGGGRWYGLQIGAAHANSPIRNDNFRSLSVTGTTEPLTLYGSNPEHLGGQTFYEFSGAANIRVLGLKTESDRNTQLMWMDNGTHNVLVTGITGDCGACWFLLKGSSNISLANLGYYGAPSNQTSTADYVTDDIASYSANDAYALFKLGSFDDSVFDISSSSTPPDTTSPSVPGNLKLSNPSKGTVIVSFSASTDNVGVAGYNIYRNGMAIASTASTSYTDSGLADGTYTYTVSAYDAAGDTSAQSPSSSITIASQSAGTTTVSPNPATRGQTITVTSKIGSTTSVSPAMVVFWYHDSAGNLIGRSAITGLGFTANHLQTVTGTFTIPSSQAVGTYSIGASIYDNSGHTVPQLSPVVSGSFTVK